MTDEYMAGLFDGEGSVMIARPTPSAPTRYQLRVVLGMTDETTVRGFHSAIGSGNIRVEHRHADWKPLYLWQETGRAAGAVLTRLRPHLITKALQADIGIEFAARKNLSGGRKGVRGGAALTAKELTTRKHLADQLTAANK